MYMCKSFLRRLIPVFLASLGFTCFRQASAQENLLLYPDLRYRIEKFLFQDPAYHAPLNTVPVSLYQREGWVDSLYGKKDHNLVRYQRGRTLIIANPVLQSSFRTGTPFLQHYVAGFRLESELSPKFSFNLNYTFHLLTNHAFPETRLDSAGIVSHWGKAVNISSSLEMLQSLNGKITYTPNRFFSFELGKDKHFWGDGYRSLFLSDNAPTYPYFATTLTIWKLKYTNFVALMHDDTLGNYSRLQTKYASMHFLSWNVNKRLNVNIFEAVVWRHRDDSLNYRGPGINYLNPFIFYRPVEYNLGSPDNVLIGFGFHYLADRQWMFYGQLLLDEFYYKDMIKGTGWWANKNAYQLGFKRFDLFNVRDLYLQMEYSQARPFTYGHDYTLQNYGYLLQPLAHPLGTNFREALMILRYARNRWFINTRFTVSRYGTEPGGRPIGGDIYVTSNHFAKTFGNYIGQGIANDYFEQEITLSRVLQARWGLVAEAGIHNSFEFLPVKQQRLYFTFGIKTLLYREDKLF